MINMPQSRDEEEIKKLSNLTNSLGKLANIWALAGNLPKNRI
jgi:hypothetical protein